MWNGRGIATLGIWLWIVPFFSASAAFYAWDSWIVGTIAALLGFNLAARRPLEGWTTGYVGAWLFIAGFIGAFRAEAGLWWNSAFVALVFLIFGIRAAVESRHAAVPNRTGHPAA